MEAAAILALVEAILAASPTIVEGVGKAKNAIQALFEADLITAAQQDALNALVDARAQLARAGVVPEHWKVQADPAS